LAVLSTWLLQRPEETGHPRCTVLAVEEAETYLEGLPERLWIVPESTPAEERAATGASMTAPGDPGATGSATA